MMESSFLQMSAVTLLTGVGTLAVAFLFLFRLLPRLIPQLGPGNSQWHTLSLGLAGLLALSSILVVAQIMRDNGRRAEATLNSPPLAGEFAFVHPGGQCDTYTGFMRVKGTRLKLEMVGPEGFRYEGEIRRGWTNTRYSTGKVRLSTGTPVGMKLRLGSYEQNFDRFSRFLEKYSQGRFVPGTCKG